MVIASTVGRLQLQRVVFIIFILFLVISTYVYLSWYLYFRQVLIKLRDELIDRLSIIGIIIDNLKISLVKFIFTVMNRFCCLGFNDWIFRKFFYYHSHFVCISFHCFRFSDSFWQINVNWLKIDPLTQFFLVLIITF